MFIHLISYGSRCLHHVNTFLIFYVLVTTASVMTASFTTTAVAAIVPSATNTTEAESSKEPLFQSTNSSLSPTREHNPNQGRWLSDIKHARSGQRLNQQTFSSVTSLRSWDTHDSANDVNPFSGLDNAHTATRLPSRIRPSDLGTNGNVSDEKDIINQKWRTIQTDQTISPSTAQERRTSDLSQSMQSPIGSKRLTYDPNRSNPSTMSSGGSDTATDVVPESNDLPTATANLEAIYERNVIPNVRQSVTQNFRQNNVDSFVVSTTYTTDGEAPQDMAGPFAKLDESIDSDDSDDLTAFSAQEINETGSWLHATVNATFLSVRLQNQGHSVLVTWTIHQNMTEVTGFIVSYKMEGREDYDSSKLGKQVRKFTLHSLHEDKEYSICVVALAKGRHTVEECKGWSQASSKMFVGIIAGVTLMVPCFFFLALIIYKDKRIKRRLKARIQQALVNDSQRSLIDVVTEKHGSKRGESLEQSPLEQNVFSNTPQASNSHMIYPLTGANANKHCSDETNFQNGHFIDCQKTKASNGQSLQTALSDCKEEKNS